MVRTSTGTGTDTGSLSQYWFLSISTSIMYCITELVPCTVGYSLQVLLQERQEGGEIVLVGVRVAQAVSLPRVDL